MQSRLNCAVTGAFGYSGKYITRKLLVRGHSVITLTNSPYRQNEFEKKIKAFPFDFEQPEKLSQSLHNIDVLFNTYWVRFNHKHFKHADAVKNTLTLFNAAKQAGVKRIVHISITNPSITSPLEYFSGKARLENALIESGLSYAILRPTVLFGREDILINNIAWALRHLPVFGVFGNGQYKLQPIYVEDLAELAVAWGQKQDNEIINAIGPETFTYRELVGAIAQQIGVRRSIISVSPAIGYGAGWVIGKLMGDVMITREEIEGLMANLLYVDTPAPAQTKLTAWIREHADTLGRHYTSELARRRDRYSTYQNN